MTLGRIQRLLPRPLRDHILHFDAAIEAAVNAFAASLPEGAKVLDAGAGESRHRAAFPHQRYVGVDLAVGDATWDYSALDAFGDLERLPFRDAEFDAALNLVTLEHVPHPYQVLRELGRVMKPGAPLLLAVPHEWEEHQVPHDYFRYTRYGVRRLLTEAGFGVVRLAPAGGYFRLMQRRLAAAPQFLPVWSWPLALPLLLPAVLLLPLLEPLDPEKRFTLGFIVEAERLP
jgi:SAM-dependent methyltransferase